MRYQLAKQAGQMSVEREDGTTVASLHKALMSVKASVVIGGDNWRFGKEFGGPLTATNEADPSMRFEANRPSLLRSGWEAVCGRTTYEIKLAGMFSSDYDVLRDGRQIGTSGRGSFWSNKPYLEVPDDVPVADAVFLLWIAFVMRARAASAAANANN